VFAADGRRLITGQSDGRVRWWDAASGREVPSQLRLARPVRGMTLVPGGGELAVAAGQNVELFSFTIDDDRVQAAGRRALTIPAGEVSALAVAPRSPHIIIGDTAGQVRLWELTGGVARTLARQHQAAVTALAVGPSSETLLTAGADGAAWLWQPLAAERAIRPLASIPAHEKGTRYLALAKGDRLISDGYDNHVRVWNLATGQQERDLGVPDSASACVLLPGGTRVAVGHWSKRIQYVELESGERQDNIRGLPRGPYAIAVAPAEDRIAAAFRELGAMVYDLNSVEADPVITLPPDELPFTHVAFAPDGQSFVTCTGDYQRMNLAGKVRLHDAKSGAVIRSFDGHTSEVKFAAFDARGKRLATASGDKTVRVWDAATGKQLAGLPHSIGTFVAAFVPDSDLLFTADYHGKVFAWNLASSTIVQEVPCHSDFVCRIALSEDLSVLASGSRDGTVKLWRLAGRGDDLRIVDAGTDHPVEAAK
jgi:WD40 repeat protein